MSHSRRIPGASTTRFFDHRYPHVITFCIKGAFPTTTDALIMAALDRLPILPVRRSVDLFPTRP
jgi:hypothetical protein